MAFGEAEWEGEGQWTVVLLRRLNGGFSFYFFILPLPLCLVSQYISVLHAMLCHSIYTEPIPCLYVVTCCSCCCCWWCWCCCTPGAGLYFIFLLFFGHTNVHGHDKSRILPAFILLYIRLNIYYCSLFITYLIIVIIYFHNSTLLLLLLTVTTDGC